MVHNSASVPGFARETTIPVTLRSLVPSLSTTFTGTLTGGNGRELSTGQTAYYQVAVPSGTSALNVSVNTGNANNTLFAELVDPSGNAVSAASNGLLATSTGGNAAIAARGRRPAARDRSNRGDVDADHRLLQHACREPRCRSRSRSPSTTRRSPPRVRKLPDSAATDLTAGTPVTAFVRVKNNGTTPEAYFVDPRLNKQVTLNLAAQSAASLNLPDIDGVVPQYLVPSHTTTIKATVSSSAPLFFDITYPYGDPDVISTTGKTATDTYSAPEVGPGDWTVTPFLVGPTGKNPARTVNANVSMTATTAGFDPAVSSPTGDLWLGSTNAAATFTPYVVKPGQSVTIPVTITPSGAAGATVSGTLYVADSSFISPELNFDDEPGFTPEGSDVAAFSYSYTIG